MPEEEEVQGTEEQDVEDKGSETDVEEFDRERAMSTIRKQRESEKQLSRELKDARAKLAQFEEQEKKRSQAEMSEVERLQAANADLEARMRGLEAERETMIIRSAVERAAAGMGFHSLEDAYHLSDLSGIAIEDDGTVEGIDKALKALAKERPYLIKQVEKPEINSAARGGGKKETDVEAVKRRYGL